ncbi:MAG: hypothetical protein GWO24_33465, partial [Akkermansiaceae bacterium]|nr:hypothetical protein [Akkermansiaceae bacterium]
MKSFCIGLAVVVASIALPAIMLKASRASRENTATSAIEQILIRCPSEIATALRPEYRSIIHDWAFDLAAKIVEDR